MCFVTKIRAFPTATQVYFYVAFRYLTFLVSLYTVEYFLNCWVSLDVCTVHTT